MCNDGLPYDDLRVKVRRNAEKYTMSVTYNNTNRFVVVRA